LDKKIQVLEHALSLTIREFEKEREIVGKTARTELNELKAVVEELKKSLREKHSEILYTRVCNHILG
jgi:hypothetical protein